MTDTSNEAGGGPATGPKRRLSVLLLNGSGPLKDKKKKKKNAITNAFTLREKTKWQMQHRLDFHISPQGVLSITSRK